MFLDIALTCIFGWHCEVCLQTVISGSVPGKSAVISIPESGLFIGLRIMGTRYRLFHLSLVHSDYSRFPETFDDIMHCVFTILH